jgi:hypothetical protein
VLLWTSLLRSTQAGETHAKAVTALKATDGDIEYYYGLHFLGLHLRKLVFFFCKSLFLQNP